MTPENTTPKDKVGNRVNKSFGGLDSFRVSESSVYGWLFEAVKLRSRVFSDLTIHVSEVVGCLRKSYYLRRRLVSTPPSVAVALLGDSMHSALQEVLRRRGYLTEFEVGLDVEDFRLVGHIDAYHPEKGVVLEFKTVGKIPEEPYETHLRQAQIYSILVKARHTYIIYISRVDGKVKIFEAPHDRIALKWAVERAKTLKKALDTYEPPKREETPLCSNCGFKLICVVGSHD